jgi:hypothetical protein
MTVCLFSYFGTVFTMNKPDKAVTFGGRFLGVAVLVVVQFIIGIIHVVFGFALFLNGFSLAAFSATPLVYSVYTLAYGCLTLLFAYLVWMGKRLGWIGAVAVSLFVIVVDILAVLEVFNVLGIPRLAAVGEVPFSLMVLAYLLQIHVRSKYGIYLKCMFLCVPCY